MAPGIGRRSPDYPLVFHPLPMERVWGGSRLREMFGKAFPEARPIGESWEIADRPDAVSVVANGPLAGVSLRELMRDFPAAMVGTAGRPDGRFPWLAKLLDAREDLSLQVHPPASIAAAMQGEPKTEMWYVAAALPGARFLAGLRPGVTREEFVRRSADGTVAGCFHELPVQAGDVLFVPSGRVHALGAGIVIFELQQNSDTTYRVFDFNRLGLDGRPRPLHVAEALRAIDFADFSPGLVAGRRGRCVPGAQRTLVQDAAFTAQEIHLGAGGRGADGRPPGSPGLVAVVQGTLRLQAGGETVRLSAGQFALLPAAVRMLEVLGETDTVYLQMTMGCVGA